MKYLLNTQEKLNFPTKSIKPKTTTSYELLLGKDDRLDKNLNQHRTDFFHHHDQAKMLEAIEINDLVKNNNARKEVANTVLSYVYCMSIYLGGR